MNLDAVVRTFKKLGRTGDADELIDFYIENRKDNPQIFDFDNYAFANDLKDKSLISKIKNAYKATSTPKTLRDVVESMSKKDGYGANEYDILKNATEDDYYHLFKSEKGEHLSRWIRTCLQFRKYQDPKESHLKIVQTVSDALKRIGRESPINALRITKYDIQ